MSDQLALADASNASILLEQTSGSLALSLVAVLVYMTKNIVNTWLGMCYTRCRCRQVIAAAKDDVRPIGSELS